MEAKKWAVWKNEHQTNDQITWYKTKKSALKSLYEMKDTLQNDEYATVMECMSDGNPVDCEKCFVANVDGVFAHGNGIRMKLLSIFA
jgi:predicted metal-binding protein